MTEAIEEFKIVQRKERWISKIKDQKFYKTIGIVYERVMDFLLTDNIKGVVISENFSSNVENLIKWTTVIHHSHITGDVVGYAYSCCNLKVRENKNESNVVAHNFFGFNFFFLEGS